MTKEEAIKVIDNRYEIMDYCESAKLEEALDIAIESLKQSYWIPCSERLPKENDTYIVCYEDASVLMDWFNGHWFFHRTNPAIEETGTITAWMPLPEPYKEENDDNSRETE